MLQRTYNVSMVGCCKFEPGAHMQIACIHFMHIDAHIRRENDHAGDEMRPKGDRYGNPLEMTAPVRGLLQSRSAGASSRRTSARARGEVGQCQWAPFTAAEYPEHNVFIWRPSTCKVEWWIALCFVKSTRRSHHLHSQCASAKLTMHAMVDLTIMRDPPLYRYARTAHANGI